MLDRPATHPSLLLTAVDGITAIQFKVLTVAIALWIVGATTAPHWLISATIVTGTVIVVTFQVRASRQVDSAALSAGTPAWAAAALLITAVVIYMVGELWPSAGGFEVSFALAPQHATGQFLGVFGLGAGLAEALGSGLLIALCISWGRPGWYVLGAMFALTALAAPPAVRWAQQHRHAG